MKAETEGKESRISESKISLPKGGGAIRGIGKKFSNNPFILTGSLIFTIITMLTRSNFYPKLSYDSAGAGNEPSGLGWNPVYHKKDGR